MKLDARMGPLFANLVANILTMHMQYLVQHFFSTQAPSTLLLSNNPTVVSIIKLLRTILIDGLATTSIKPPVIHCPIIDQVLDVSAFLLKRFFSCHKYFHIFIQQIKWLSLRKSTSYIFRHLLKYHNAY